MLNTIIAFSVAGVISASGAGYLLQLENRSAQVASAYVADAQQRFDEYNQILPGIVRR